jgi:DNA primase
VELTSDFKELVRSRTEIVSLIGESTTLIPERGGAEYKCLCPFHEDHNPSMRVYPDRQSFRCWVCDEGGDVFTWVMKREALSFPETMRFLAERAHLEMPEQSKHQSDQFAKKEELHAVLKWAEMQFHECFLKRRTGLHRRARLQPADSRRISAWLPPGRLGLDSEKSEVAVFDRRSAAVTTDPEAGRPTRIF